MKSTGADMVVVIPTYNERENIEALLSAVLAETEADVLVVDDESPDGTGALVEELTRSNPRISVLRRRGKKRGFGASYIDGFSHTIEQGYLFVVQMDADFSHNPKDIMRLRDALENSDLAIGSRYVRGGQAKKWGVVRRIISRGGSLYARFVLGVSVRDLTGGFKCWKAEALRRVNFQTVGSNGFSFQIEMNYRACRSGLKVVEVPISFVDRTQGKSKMSSKIFFEALLYVWKVRFSGWK
jgi:dolichol-phosphate mannosyltransferase